MLRLRAALGVLLALAPVPALAWGGAGHRAIAAIAWANVTPATRAAATALLRQSALLDTPECPVRTLSDAAVWPDCIRQEKDRFQHTARWHYQNIEICRPFDPAEDCADGNCVTAKIDGSRRALADRSRTPKDRLSALAFLAHLVGDVHQPLHAADDNDHGGGQVTIAGGRFDGMTLHQVWDGPVAQEAIQLGGGPLVRGYSPAERQALGGGTVADWARESWGLARTQVYPAALGADPCASSEPQIGHVDPQAFSAALPVARRRILQAGLRLARLLDGALGA